MAEIISLVAIKMNGASGVCLNDFSELLVKLQPYVFCYFVTQYFTSRDRWLKSFWSVLCLLLFATAYGGGISFFVGLAAALCFSYFYEKFNRYVSFSLTSISSVIFGLLMKYLADFINNIEMSLAYSISHKCIITAVLFGVITFLLSVFGNTSIAELFFYKSYGGTVIIEEEVITGIKDIIEKGYDGKLIAEFMTGHYFVLFALVGVTLALCDELKASQKICLIIVSVFSVLSGNISLLVFYIFLESWHLFLSLAFISALSYIASAMLDIRCGYLLNGGIIELLMNINKPVYLVVGGVVFVAIGFFVAKYSSLKYGLSDRLNIYIPTRLNKLVSSLGGVVNIVRINEDTLEVRNPQLVNNFEIECEIRENTVKISQDKIDELREYIE